MGIFSEHIKHLGMGSLFWSVIVVSTGKGLSWDGKMPSGPREQEEAESVHSQSGALLLLMPTPHECLFPPPPLFFPLHFSPFQASASNTVQDALTAITGKGTQSTKQSPWF